VIAGILLWRALGAGCIFERRWPVVQI